MFNAQFNASLSIKYIATARCRIRISLLFHSSRLELGFSMMYFTCPCTFSTQEASHDTVLSWRTSFHRRPGGGDGILLSCEQLIMTSSGITRLFTRPIFGCSPRPRNKPGGSILKLPIFSLCPSITQMPYSFVSCSFAAFRAAFSSLLRFRFCSAISANDEKTFVRLIVKCTADFVHANKFHRRGT
uniref:Uncharacterized protein n=1 Tax=Anopheles melas TaxID=34690 RepID=A0A182UH79_9DIPT